MMIYTCSSSSSDGSVSGGGSHGSSISTSSSSGLTKHYSSSMRVYFQYVTATAWLNTFSTNGYLWYFVANKQHFLTRQFCRAT